MAKALVFLAPGAEDMEFVVIVDILRRGGIDVVVGGVESTEPAVCRWKVKIVPDVHINDAEKHGPFDIMIVPGGVAGVDAVSKSVPVGKLLKKQEEAGKMVGAICAERAILQVAKPYVLVTRSRWADKDHKKKALVLLAPGAEEIEFTIAVDVLRRAEVSVYVAGVKDTQAAKCGRKIKITPDIHIQDVKSFGPFDAVILPGGHKGVNVLSESKQVGKVLRRQEKAGGIIAAIGAAVYVAGVKGTQSAKCSRNVKITPDIHIIEAKNYGPYDAIILPGGHMGANILSESKHVGKLLMRQEKAGGIIAAICAGPAALKSHKIYQGKTLTSYPTVENSLREGGYTYKSDRVVVDGPLITSRAPGTAFEFALAIVDKLVGKEKAAEVSNSIMLH